LPEYLQDLHQDDQEQGEMKTTRQGGLLELAGKATIAARQAAFAVEEIDRRNKTEKKEQENKKEFSASRRFHVIADYR